MRNTPSALLRSLVRSFVRSGERFLPLPPSRKSTLRFANVKKNKKLYGREKKSGGSNQRQAPNDSRRLRLGNDVGGEFSRKRLSLRTK